MGCGDLRLAEFHKTIGCLEVGADDHICVALVGNEYPLIVLGCGRGITPLLLNFTQRHECLGRDHATPLLVGGDLLEDLLRIVQFSHRKEGHAFPVGDIAQLSLRSCLLYRVIIPPDGIGRLVACKAEITHSAIGILQQITLGERADQFLEIGLGLFILAAR